MIIFCIIHAVTFYRVKQESGSSDHPETGDGDSRGAWKRRSSAVQHPGQPISHIYVSQPIAKLKRPGLLSVEWVYLYPSIYAAGNKITSRGSGLEIIDSP